MDYQKGGSAAQPHLPPFVFQLARTRNYEHPLVEARSIKVAAKATKLGTSAWYKEAGFSD